MMESFRHSIDYKYPRAVEFSGKTEESRGKKAIDILFQTIINKTSIIQQ